MVIDRCMRTRRTFCDLIDEARAERLSLSELIARLEALGCDGACQVYLRRAYRTGQTCFGYPLAEVSEPPPNELDTVAHRPVMHA